MSEISTRLFHSVLPVEKQQQIIDSVFGKQQPAASPEPSVTPSPTTVQTATQNAANSYQQMLNSRKTALEQQRTDSAKMAKYNALGNLLTSIVQPIGWAAGGSTAGVIPYDSRQYLDSFNRALKADEQLRNIGTMEAEYQFKLDEEARQRAIAEEEEKRNRENAWAEYQKKKDYEAKIQSDLYKQRYEEEMRKIAARGQNQLTLEEVKARYKAVGRGGVPIGDKMLSAAWTKYQAYKDKYETDVSRGNARSDKLKTFEEWIGPEYGWILRQKGSSDEKPTNSGAPKNSEREHGITRSH